MIEATVDGYFLKVRADMMIAKGILEVPKVPYFYCQEYKKRKDPKGRLFRIYLIFPPVFVLGWGRFSVVFEFFFFDCF